MFLCLKSHFGYLRPLKDETFGTRIIRSCNQSYNPHVLQLYVTTEITPGLHAYFVNASVHESSQQGERE